MGLSQVIFCLLLLVFAVLIGRRVHFLARCILQGRSHTVQRPFRKRLGNMLLVAFGQRRMFTQPLPATLHLLVYLGFLLINLEVLEIILDGLLGTHRLLLPFLGTSYAVLISFFEVLAVLVFFACFVFFLRRNLLKVSRFRGTELKGWPRLDANLILVVEMALMVVILCMDASDLLLQKRAGAQYPSTSEFLVTQWLTGSLRGLSTDQLMLIERACWWTHIVGIFGFAYYITYSKHLHIFFAFPNTYFSDLEVPSLSIPLPQVTKELKSMLSNENPAESTTDPQHFGVKNVSDLTRKQLLEAFTCTECGRCSAVCPAQASGKLLSPRKVMMDVRDSAIERITHQNTSKDLLEGYIKLEEINACTTCQACIDACPLQINPMEILISLRQYIAMETEKSPTEWQHMYANVENNGAPWKFPAHSRADWQKSL